LRNCKHDFESHLGYTFCCQDPKRPGNRRGRAGHLDMPHWSLRSRPSWKARAPHWKNSVVWAPCTVTATWTLCIARMQVKRHATELWEGQNSAVPSAYFSNGHAQGGEARWVQQFPHLEHQSHRGVQANPMHDSRTRCHTMVPHHGNFSRSAERVSHIGSVIGSASEVSTTSTARRLSQPCHFLTKPRRRYRAQIAAKLDRDFCRRSIGVRCARGGAGRCGGSRAGRAGRVSTAFS
jgi:hypothetical protein